ncbi:DUF4360 domain-containing protein [Nostoc sp. CHAB 5784]|uniref:DUF4360 domain-containing protein n=1 Tax=Nostoc mirabile TaxID=2907820 RepID=UPI001E3AC614|nr:DUF4360 domain-containing protein [Nostoc mirabile]MCC5668634.1 DUF4360 domain-containing protein [Nostoc mirabile CHAB5784]
MQFIKQLKKQLGFLVLVGSGIFSASSASAQISVTTITNTEGNVPPNVPSRPTPAFEFRKYSVIPMGYNCPPGTAEAILHGDTLSIVFSKLEAIAPRTKAVGRFCNLWFPFDVPVGLNAQPISLLYNGFADVPKGGNADVNVRLFFKGTLVPTIPANPKQTFGSGFSDSWSQDVALVLDTINACKKPVSSVFTIINTAVIARATNLSATPASLQTQVRIDTLNTAIGPVLFQIKFAFLPCT